MSSNRLRRFPLFSDTDGPPLVGVAVKVKNPSAHAPLAKEQTDRINALRKIVFSFMRVGSFDAIVRLSFIALPSLPHLLSGFNYDSQNVAAPEQTQVEAGAFRGAVAR
jgi:hypothetical protein